MLQRSRILAMATLTVVLLLFLVMEGRLFIIQILQSSPYAEQLQNYLYKRVEVEVPRGDILDSRGDVLATSIPALDVWAYVRELDKPWTPQDETQETVGRLAMVLDLPASEIRRNLARGAYRPIKRDVTDPELIRDLFRVKRAGKLRGVDLCKKYCRRYAHGALLGHTLGFVDHSNRGVFGVEAFSNDFLQGRPGCRIFKRDGVQNEIFSPNERQVRGAPGGDIYLTIDTALQIFAELELAEIDRLHRPKWSAAVVVEPSTGRILAAASMPGLDPSRPAQGGAEHWMNRVFAAEYTPGSTFKPIMMTIAHNQGVVNPREVIDCEDGAWWFKRRRISDLHRYGDLDLAGVLIKSSNIGMSKIASRLVPEDTPRGGKAFTPIFDTLNLLGFGKRTGVLSPDQESPGKVTSLERWTLTYTLLSLSFGNEIAVTPIQMAAALSTLANGGMYLPPRLIDRMVFPDGHVVTPPKAPGRRVFSEASSRTVRNMMVRVVEEGSGRKARIPGIRVAGKTGTSEKLPARTEVTASFAAFAPADQPAVLVLVVVDEPQGAHLASRVAVPHVKNILEKALLHLGVTCRSVESPEGDRET